MNNRLLYIDVIKAFAILCVVLGHVCGHYVNSLNSFIGDYFVAPVAMPLFAILSGFFYNNQLSTKDFLKRKIHSLAIPFLVWCFIVFVLIRGLVELYNYIFCHQKIHFLSWVNCYIQSVVNWGWWFLRALFLCYIYAFLCEKILNNRLGLALFVSVLLLWMCSFGGIIPNKNESLIGFVFIYPFFVSSIYLKRHWTYVRHNSKFVFILSMIAFVCCLTQWHGYADTFYSMNTSILERQGAFDVVGMSVVLKTLFRYITGLSGSIFIILLFRFFSYSNFVVRYIQPIGMNTLGIYIIHFYIVDLLPQRTLDNELLMLIITVFASVLIVVLCNSIIEITSKVGVLRSYLWGKK